MSGVDVITMGCRLNAYESEVMRRHAEDAGLENTVIVNTCAVTTEAERQARQRIRKAKRADPDTRIIVTGCAAQVNAESFADMPEVDRILGNTEKMEAKSYTDFGVGESERVAVNDIMSVTETAGHMIDGFADKARAFVQIQNGCNHRCTFCIIPYGRGNSRSVPMGAVVDQVRQLTANGYAEIVLTGVDITAYGADLPGGPPLGQLCKRLLKAVPELKRLRISSIDSVEVDDDLMDLIAGEERLMPHLHLSLQAGDDMILKRMKRRHSRDAAIRFCEEARRLRPDIVFGADIIAGFPTETADMFARSLDLVDECGLSFLHVFPFSPRPGTPAAKMPQLPAPVIKDRAARLRAKGDAARQALFVSLEGQTLRFMAERGENGVVRGYTDQFVPVAAAGEAAPGQIVRAEISGHDKAGLRGVIAHG